MSNIFVTDVIGSSTYAVPASDAALAAATSGFDGILSGVANLAYDRVLAWVEDAGGPGGAEGNRTLNCLIEKFTYSGEECPDETEVDTMTGAIETALEADADITSIGQQQVHIFQAGAYFLWQRDATGGFLYPNVNTDDVAVGNFAAPSGKWFNDGDLVLGGSTMSGAEVLRVIGDARLEGGLLMVEEAAVPIAPAATEGVFWVKDDAPNVPYFTDDAGTDHQLAYASAAAKSLPDIDQIIFVDKTSGAYAADGTIQYPYNSINSAIAAANALSPGSGNRILIMIYPGVYSEAVSTQDDYVSFAGFDKHTTIIQQAGGSPPLTLNDRNISFHNLTFECAAGSTTYIVARTGISTDPVYFYDCDFLGTAGHASNYINNDLPLSMHFRGCRLLQGDTSQKIYDTSGSSTSEHTFVDCEIVGVLYLQASSTAAVYEYRDCSIVSAATSGQWYTTVYRRSGGPAMRFYDCYIENTSTGYSYYSIAAATSETSFFGGQMVTAGPINDMDSNGTSYVTMSGVKMSKGMSNNIRTLSHVKYSDGSAGDLDYYTDIEDAVTSLVSADDGCVIHMLGSYSANTQVVQDVNITVTIDGHDNVWTDTSPASGFTILCGAGVNILRNINFVGATVTSQGAGTVMVVDGCDISGAVYQRGNGDDASTLTVIHDSSVTGHTSGGATMYVPLSINTTLPTIIVSQSYLKGYTGYEAVQFNNLANENLKIEHSTLMHGSLGANNPFAGVPSQIDYAAHHTTFNAEPDIATPADYNNVIDLAQRQNTIDADGDYGWRNYV